MQHGRAFRRVSWWERAQLGSTMARDSDFEAFYAATYDRLVGQLLVVTGSLQDAEDVVQEAAPESGIHTRRTRTPPPGSPWWTTEDNRFHHLPEGGAAPGDLRPGGLR